SVALCGNERQTLRFTEFRHHDSSGARRRAGAGKRCGTSGRLHVQAQEANHSDHLAAHGQIGRPSPNRFGSRLLYVRGGSQGIWFGGRSDQVAEGSQVAGRQYASGWSGGGSARRSVVTERVTGKSRAYGPRFEPHHVLLLWQKPC